MTGIAENLAKVRERIASSAERAGRRPDEVVMVVAGKYATDAQLAEAIEAGVSDVGENRADAMRRRMETMGTGVRWHYMGEVQSNKVKLLDGAHLVHSVDRAEEAEALQRRAEATGGRFEVLVEVNVAGEASKQGVAPDALDGLVGSISCLDRVSVRGLMIVAPQAERPDDIRWVFERARGLRDRLGLEELSMGMSEDFEVAVEEGSTIVRLGRAVFQGE